jgi:hypothetical protein
VTVVSWKLVQSALRDSMGVRPGRVPVTWRAQLSALQARLSKALAMTAAAKERTTATFILMVDWVAVGLWEDEGVGTFDSWLVLDGWE